MEQPPRLLHILLIILTLYVIISCDNAEKPSSRTAGESADSTRTAIVALHQRAVTALNKGDLQNLMSVYAEDVISMPPNQSPRVGKAAVQEMWENVLDIYQVHVAFQPQEVYGSGDLAYERGTYEMTLNPKAGGALLADTGKYLDILKLQPDGNWKYFRVSWSSNR